MLAPLAATLAIPAALHIAWRVRHGYPPEGFPRVLCFHKISARFCLEGTWTTPRRLAATVDRLQARGWRFIGEDEYLAALDGAPDPASRRVWLTFDDGYAHLLDSARPILAQRGVPWHVFMVTDYAGRANTWDLSLGRPASRHLDWNEVHDLAAAGVTFGSHTAAHHDVTTVGAAELAADLARSRDALAGVTGRVPRTLSYPFGRYNDAARAAVVAAGYRAAFSLYPHGRNDAVDRYALRRDAVYIIDPVWGVETKLVRNPLFGLEEMKCRAINGVARLTPLLKKSAGVG
ncbi:MAG TPA: polysaccharide deacetylase family protein [Candidatus Krumholzibacteria bacterium]|nr:polysaccharide deacetylase family protein [Candidatus Krumholzibacteria bacterium]